MSAARMQRRDFLRASLAAGGGLLLSFWWPASASAAGQDAGAGAGAGGGGGGGGERDEFAPNAFVRVAPDGQVTVIVNKAEMGQGVCTSLAMLVAEELDADWSRVGFEFAPVGDAYVHPGFGLQLTGGSTSVAGMSEPLRKAGAAARAMLVAAAAQLWGVEPGACRTEKGVVLHEASGRRAGYGELAGAAAAQPVPQDVPLKDPSRYLLLGRPTRRLDAPAKVAGTALFSLDVNRPGMLVALVERPPTFGGTVHSVDAEAARAVPDVVAVAAIDAGVAVIARGFWAAKKGREALRIEWDPGPHAALDTDTLREEFRLMATAPGAIAHQAGDPPAALRSASQVLIAEYELPYLAHAPMEPLNCVVDLQADRCEIWAGSQFQTVDRAAAARAAGLAPEQVQIHTTFMGGGFGRRANPASDFIVEGVQVARAAGAPVKLMWTREDDLRGGWYRPMWHSRISAALDAGGRISAWTHTIVGQSITAGTPFEPFTIKDGIDSTSVEGAVDLPYAIPNVQVDLHSPAVGVPAQWWRSVGHSHTAFVVECFLDELAAASKTDPLTLRLQLLDGQPRMKAVLQRAAAEAGWDSPAPAGRARGLALHHSFETTVAQVAEVSLEGGQPRVHRVTCAVDCGRVVNPDGVAAQLEGAVGFGLTAVLHGAITLREGRVQQSNFHDYRMLRIPGMPQVDVHIVPSDERSTGVGEPGVPPVAPAVCNAFFALTGKRIRRLPLRADELRG